MYRRHVRNVSERQSAFIVFINFFFHFLRTSRPRRPVFNSQSWILLLMQLEFLNCCIPPLSFCPMLKFCTPKIKVDKHTYLSRDKIPYSKCVSKLWSCLSLQLHLLHTVKQLPGTISYLSLLLTEEEQPQQESRTPVTLSCTQLLLLTRPPYGRQPTLQQQRELGR